MSSTDSRPIKVIAFDVDGTLTDATTWYGGEELGWVQVYSVRDGEALLRLAKRGLTVLPLSRNLTESARRRVEGLKLDTRFLGVTHKLESFEELCGVLSVDAAEVCFIGDGIDDAPVLLRAGVGAVVNDAHPEAKRCADVVLVSKGGHRAIEELETYLEKSGRIPRL
jgi:3-deoxy-D-manno-octulosonate 8-phosphate phosphatase (KDO 8-P phosphatase)